MGKYIGVLGALLIIVGAFLPVVTSPSTGSISYMQGEAMMWKGISLIIIGVICMAVFYKDTKLYEIVGSLVTTGILALFLLVMYMQITRLDSSSNDAMGRGLQNLLDAKLGLYSLAWGWLVMFGGCVLMLISAFRKH